MEALLDAYKLTGTLRGAAIAIKFSHESAYNWKKRNYLGLRDRLVLADDIIADEIEGILFDKLRGANCAPVLIIFALKKWKKEYRDQSNIDMEQARREIRDIMGALGEVENAAHVDELPTDKVSGEDYEDQILNARRTDA
jgi:hypothetical protein